MKSRILVRVVFALLVVASGARAQTEFGFVE
jgi:hypothetical protein